MKVRFIYGGALADARLIAEFAANAPGRCCVLHPPFSPFAKGDFGVVESRAIGVDFLMMNGLEEETAFRLAQEFASSIVTRTSDVEIAGVELTRCLSNMFDLRLERILLIVQALEALKREGYDSVLVWARAFSRFQLAALPAEALQNDDTLSRIADGRIESQASQCVSHPFDPVGVRILAREAAQAPASRGNPPIPSDDLTVFLHTSAHSYIEEIRPVLDALDAAGSSHRLLLHDSNVLKALGNDDTASGAVLLDDAHPILDSWAPEHMTEALRSLFSALDNRAPVMPGDPLEAALERIFPLALHASVYRRAWRFCMKVARLDAWLARDRTRRFFFYPCVSGLDPAPRMLMRARGGKAATAVFRSITEHFRNFTLPAADELAVMGMDQARVALARGFDEKGARMVGAPLVDAGFAAVGANEKRDRDEILVATSGFDTSGEQRWIAALAEWLRARGRGRMILRPHPSRDEGFYRDIMGADDEHARIDRTTDIHLSIDQAAAVLTDVSHVGKLAVYRDRPLATVNLSGTPFPYHRFDEQGVATGIDTLAALKTYAENVLAGALPPLDPRARARFIRDEFTSDDGLSGARMASFLTADTPSEQISLS